MIDRATDTALMIFQKCFQWLLNINVFGEWKVETYIIWFFVVATLFKVLENLAGFEK